MTTLDALTATTATQMQVPTWVWYLTVGLMAAVLLFDVFIIARRPHVPSTKEVSISLAGYIGAALLFGLGVWYFTHDQAGAKFMTEYYAGWLTEYSLSVDNLFIFLLIMARFGVPEKLQQSALLIGIIIAIILRGIFIAVGAAAINQFSWVFYIFGAFLIYTAFKLGKEGESDDEEYEENRFMKFVERRFPATDQYDGAKLFTHVNGKKLATPMFIVIMALGTTDLLFALDSIPAIYGLTKEPYLVLTANLFALMGLRQLLLPHRRAAQEARLPDPRSCRPAGLHRRQAGAARPARERAAVHQRWRARDGRSRHPHLGVARRDRRDPRCHDRGQPVEVPQGRARAALSLLTLPDPCAGRRPSPGRWPAPPGPCRPAAPGPAAGRARAGQPARRRPVRG